MLLIACQYPVLLVPTGCAHSGVHYFVVTEHDVLLPAAPDGEYLYPLVEPGLARSGVENTTQDAKTGLWKCQTSITRPSDGALYAVDIEVPEWDKTPTPVLLFAMDSVPHTPLPVIWHNGKEVPCKGLVVDALWEAELRKGLTVPGDRYAVPVFRLRNAREGRVWSGGAAVAERAYIGDGLVRVEDM